MPTNDTLALIPARGGSKGVPEKNIKPLAGAPLIAYSIIAGREAEAANTVVVSTDDPEIADVAESYEARVPFDRPDELALDSTPTEPVISHAIQYLKDIGENFQDLILLQPTSPLRNGAHIDEAYEKYKEGEADSLISAWPCYDDLWVAQEAFAEKIIPSDAPSQRQQRDPVFITNGAIYISSVQAFMETQDLTNGQTMIYEMSERASIDIDTPFDLWLAEQVMDGSIDD